MSPQSSAKIPCVKCGEPRIGLFHRRCAEHENPEWRKKCFLCQRNVDKPHDTPIGPYVTPLRGDVL